MSRKYSTSGASSPSRQALTPATICDFVRSCFTESLCDVDFTQALRAIEYLAVLDDRRKREACAALRRLNVDESNVALQKQSLRANSPDAYERVCSIEDKSRKAEALYTQAYIGLRRWALINEMRLMPFNKRNCSAILDELYPPTYTTLPTPQLTQLILDNQRDAFSKYIKTVEKLGRSVLKNLENQSKRPTDANGWPVVRDILERYLRHSTRVIEVCTSTKGLEMFDRRPPPPKQTPMRSTPPSSHRPNLGPASTFPMATPKRPSTSQGVSPQLKKEQQEWLQRQQQQQQKQEPPRQLKKSSSTLGRLAREFRRIKSKSSDSNNNNHRAEPHQRSHSAMENRPGPILRSRTSFNMSREPSKESKHSRNNSAEREVLGMYHIDDAYRERLIQEAKRNKETKEHKRQHSPTHFKLEEERRYNGNRKQFRDEIEEDRFFFITDSATRETPMTANANPYVLPQDEFRIAELAA